MEELKDYDISQFKSAYVMGGLAITNDIKSLIAGAAMKQEETPLPPSKTETAIPGATKTCSLSAPWKATPTGIT
jgi:hypothetical protein